MDNFYIFSQNDGNIVFNEDALQRGLANYKEAGITNVKGTPYHSITFNLTGTAQLELPFEG